MKRLPALWGLLVFASVSSGCLDIESYNCTGDIECLVDGVQGTCQASTQSCIYPAESCPSRFADGEGKCVTGSPGDGSSSITTDPSTSTSTSSTAGDPTTLTMSTTLTTAATMSTSMTASTSTTGLDDTGSSTTSSEICGGAQTENLTDQGSVGASSVFMNFNPPLSVDGDFSTSWFSSGPEPGDAPSVFTWTQAQDVCVSRVLVFSNALHENESFQEGFGFESVTIRVVDVGNNTNYEQTHDLSGTPDPDLNIDIGGVMGNRVILELADHEDPSCGGFSELQVVGAL